MIDRTAHDAETIGLLRQGVSALARRLRATRQDSGVSLTGLSVLGRLHHTGARTPSALAADERMQPQSLTRVLAALDDKGLITKDADPSDRRQILVRLTEAGTAVLRADARQREAWLTTALSRLSPTERDLLRLAAGLMLDLARMDEAMDEAETGASSDGGGSGSG